MPSAGLEVLRKLRAYEAGRPQPRGKSVTTYVAAPSDLLAVAFVRMGGETRPWAVGTRKGDGPAVVHTVPDGRQADPIGAMLVDFAHTLCRFLESPVMGDGGAREREEFCARSPRQVWLPNGAHLDMLHMLNLRYTFAGGGEPDREQALRALGRAAGYLFRESGCGGEVGVVDASRALRQAYTFPVDEVRASHLGLLIALLEEEGDRDSVTEAAENAERDSVSTSLDPALERDELAPLVETYGDRGSEAKEAIVEIDRLLTSEVERRLDLTLRAVEILRSDERPVNEGVADLCTRTMKSRWYEFMSTENEMAAEGRWGPPSAETDRSKVAGTRRFIRMAGAEEVAAGALLLHDQDLIDEAVAVGDAVHGVVFEIERRVPPGRRQRAAHWSILIPEGSLVRVKPGTALLPTEPGLPKGVLERVRQEEGRRFAVLRMVRPRGGPDPAGEAFLGLNVTLVQQSVDFSITKMSKLSRDPGPGSWLTASGDPPAPDESGTFEVKDLLEEVEGLRAT